VLRGTLQVGHKIINKSLCKVNKEKEYNIGREGERKKKEGKKRRREREKKRREEKREKEEKMKEDRRRYVWRGLGGAERSLAFSGDNQIVVRIQR
jgi:hypothetical protein